MIYYKLVNNSNIVDVNTDETLYYVKYSERSHCMLLCQKNENPLGIVASDGSCAYHLVGADPIPIGVIGTFLDVELVPITEEEYIVFKRAIDEQREKDRPEPIPDPPEPEPEPTDEEREREEEYRRSIQFVRDTKIEYLSYLCNKTIENGIDVVLSDGETHHFSLTKEDQINLMERQAQLSIGATSVSYHADGEICTYYSAEDMMKIIASSIFHKDFQTTYFNSLKHYVNSLETLEAISAITYGQDIPVEYQSEPLKALLAQLEPENENS